MDKKDLTKLTESVDLMNRPMTASRSTTRTLKAFTEAGGITPTTIALTTTAHISEHDFGFVTDYISL